MTMTKEEWPMHQILVDIHSGKEKITITPSRFRMEQDTSDVRFDMGMTIEVDIPHHVLEFIAQAIRPLDIVLRQKGYKTKTMKFEGMLVEASPYAMTGEKTRLVFAMR